MPLRRLYQRDRTFAQRGSLGSDPTPEAGRTVAAVSESLDHLEERLRRLRTAVNNLAQLQQIQERLAASDQLALAAEEVRSLEQQAEELELAVSSEFFSWQQLKEPFWQAVRFGGLGLVVGWLLRAWFGS